MLMRPISHPAIAADAGQNGEDAMASQVETRDLFAFRAEEPDMRQAGAGPTGRLVMQLGVFFEGRFRLAVGGHGLQALALLLLRASQGLRQSLRNQPCRVDGIEIPVSASIGSWKKPMAERGPKVITAISDPARMMSQGMAGRLVVVMGDSPLSITH